MKPDFLLVAPPKSGTTAISEYMDRHPSISLAAVKEPFYFTSDSIKHISDSDKTKRNLMASVIEDELDYQSLWDRASVDSKCFEASVNYFYYHREAVPRIIEMCGDIPIIIVLRNPYDRLKSAYNFNRFETRSLNEALKQELSGLKDDYNPFVRYVFGSLYAEHLDAWMQSFSSVLILTYDEFSTDAEQTLSKIMDFLDLPHEEISTSDRINETFVTKWIFLSRLIAFKNILGIDISRFKFTILLKKIIYTKKKRVHYVDDIVRKKLDSLFREDITKTEAILGRNLSQWKDSSL